MKLLVVSLCFCLTYALTCKNLELIGDYVTWKNTKNLIILSEPFFQMKKIVEYFKFFSSLGVFVSFQTPERFLQMDNLLVLKTAVISFADNDRDNLTNSFYDEASKLDLFRDNLFWLIVTEESGLITDKLRFTSLGLNADLVLASRTRFSRSEDTNITSANVSTPTKRGKEHSNGVFLPFTNMTNTRMEIKDEMIEECNTKMSSSNSYCLLQIYKIRRNSNTSLVIHPLGVWDPTNRMTNLAKFIPTEKRTNFHKFPLIFGKKNVTLAMTASENVIEDDDDEEKLIEVGNYFKLFFNARAQIVYFQKLGHKETDGEWTDLLRAVVDEEVDLGLERIVKTTERRNDMAFSHKILKSMRNIYIRPQESNELRDIFLIPFGPRLILCVVITGVIFVVLVALVGKMGIGDAAVWCVGVFSMQGSVWKPNSYAGNIILIISMAFALVIYNSYSAFITSILSVELPNIRSVDDLLESDYSIGYAKNSQDEIYLRTTNDTELQHIYLRGYLHNTVNNITEGLLRSTKGHYGFFASANLARKKLQIINNYRCNDDIVEIQIPATKNIIAFPLSKNSPYRKLINLSIMKMYETGVYKYLHSIIVPNLSTCEKRRIFRSAHLPDLMTAFGILLVGIQLALVAIVGECLCKRRSGIVRIVKRKIFKQTNADLPYFE